LACGNGGNEGPPLPDPGLAPPADAGDASVTLVPEGDCDDECAYPVACAEGAFCPVNVDVAPNETLTAVCARSAGDVWMAGNAGALLHYDGSVYRREATPRKETFSAMLARPEGMWVFSSLLSSYLVTGERSAEGALVLAPHGESTEGHTSGLVVNAWSSDESSWLWLAVRTYVSSHSPDATFVRVRRQGSVLERESVGGDTFKGLEMRGVDARSKDEVWVVGERGSAYRIDNAESSSPSVVAINTQTNDTLNAVSVASDGTVWAVGNVGTIRRYTGGTVWERMEPPSHATLNDVKAVSPSEVWAVGDRATVLHYDGDRWRRIPVAGLGGTRPSLRGVVALDHHRVLAVGERVVVELRTAEGGAP
ncbi:MAG: hypothetical protein K0S65_5088, partial [Labilithrix sp.]|nr:hypothetical protein [Labilithrix sp.]